MAIELPNLARLRLCEPDDAEDGDWFYALAGASRPKWKPWKRLRGSDKAVFRALADRSENDRYSAGQYEGPYSGVDIDVIIRQRLWSVEHIVPRSRINGRRPGVAEDDPFGWVLETRQENSRRRNYPLVLWKTGAVEPALIEVDGVVHYDFDDASKGRVARKWLYIRAVYGGVDDIDPMTEAQRRHLDEILEIATGRLDYAEGRYHLLLVDWVTKTFGSPWQNPLLGDDRLEILRDRRFRAMVVG
jgi:hypothetical protein